MNEPQSSKPADEETRPHPLANEMATEESFDPARVETARADEERRLAPPKDRLVGRWVLGIVGGGVALALVLALILMPDRPPWMIAATALWILLYAVLFMWPVLAARGAKLAQDEEVRERKAGRK